MMTMINLFKQVAVLMPCAAILLLSVSGCSSDVESITESPSDSLSIEEINAARGDACECISSTLEKVDAFSVRLNAGEYTTSSDLNSALILELEGCMTPIGNKEADAAWLVSMSGCESFLPLREAMMMVSQAAALLKQAEETEMLKQREDEFDTSKILNRLSDGK